MGGTQSAVLRLVLQGAVVPVNGEGVTTDGGLLLAVVVTAATGEGRGATGAAQDGFVEDDGAVRLVLVGRRVGGFDVQVVGHDGVGHGDESAELEERELHCG